MLCTFSQRKKKERFPFIGKLVIQSIFIHTQKPTYTQIRKKFYHKNPQLNPIFYNFNFPVKKTLSSERKIHGKTKIDFHFLNGKFIRCEMVWWLKESLRLLLLYPFCLFAKYKIVTCVCYLLLWCLQIRRQMILITKSELRDLNWDFIVLLNELHYWL